MFAHKSFQKTMKYNELKVTGNARLWRYEAIKEIKDLVARIDDDLWNVKRESESMWRF